MGDIFSVLAAGYTSKPPTPPSHTTYVPVDATQWEGTWKGTYSTGEKFSFTVSNVEGFRAKVRYQSGNGPIKFQDILIKDNAFKMGDFKFLMSKDWPRHDQDRGHQCRHRAVDPEFGAGRSGLIVAAFASARSASLGRRGKLRRSFLVPCSANKGPDMPILRHIW